MHDTPQLKVGDERFHASARGNRSRRFAGDDKEGRRHETPENHRKRAIGAGMSLAPCVSGSIVPTTWATPQAATRKPVLTMGLTKDTVRTPGHVSG
jgi:hypothetical protein